VFQVWRRHDCEQEGTAGRLQRLTALIRSCHRVEEYLWPRASSDWLHGVCPDGDKAGQGKDLAGQDLDLQPLAAASDEELLEAFRDLVRRWQVAAILPIDQLVLTIAQDLFVEPSELALSHKLAVMLRAASDQNPEWRLPELTAELALIARNQRRFLGFDDEGTNTSATPGKVTVSTLHKAKGLEWDRVYIASVNNYDFPSSQPYDEYISERWFVRDQLNLEAEVLAQLDSLLGVDSYDPGQATIEARLDYVRERLRLLYVGITRAKKELILTWNTGRSREPKQMAVPLIALHTWWEGKQKTR
jgi:DNA helicase-2/ATP-dependent DNA helicase PcrA